MSEESLPVRGNQSFEDLKRLNEHGAEYWSARDLQPLLGYGQWRRFEDAIKRALTSCQQSGNQPDHHFAGAGKMVELGSGSSREIPDYHLSPFCLLSHRPKWRPSQTSNRPRAEIFRHPSPPPGNFRCVGRRCRAPRPSPPSVRRIQSAVGSRATGRSAR